MIKIRHATQDDAAAMARVIVDTWFDAHQYQVSNEALQQRRQSWGYAESEKGWRRSLAAENDPSTQILVATDADTVIAVAATERTSETTAEMGVLYVAKDYQHTGIGAQLFNTAVRHFRALGIATLNVAVLATNTPARTFYENLGGYEVGERNGADGREAVYAWNLNATAAGNE